MYGRCLLSLIVGIGLTLTMTDLALATDDPNHDSGTLAVRAPWGPANQDPNDSLRVEVTYRVRANGRIPVAAVDAVEAAIDTWEAAINGCESGWAFDLVEFSGGPPSKPDIKIRLKKGGGRVAGQSLRKIDRDGFTVGAKIIISGSFLGTPSDVDTITEITLHEFGHALSLGHHSNQNDLMGTSLGHSDGTPIDSVSECDLDGFEAAHHWLAIDLTATPHLNHATSIVCP